MKRQIVRFILMLALVASKTAFAENSVVVESRTFYAGQRDRVVGVYLSNDVRITGLVLPFEFRELTPGSFPSAHLLLEENLSGRIHPSQLGLGGAPPAWIRRSYLPVPGGSICSGPVSNTYSTPAGSVDFQSPDAVLWIASGDCWPDEICWLDPGNDLTGSGIASYKLRFDVSVAPGQFEIDTCCVRPAIHLAYVDFNTSTLRPSFTKGVVTIAPCSCPCAADPVCDGVYDINDVSTLVDVAFRGEPDTSDSTCSVSRTDVNADGQTDVTDVVKLIFVAFLGQPPETYFVNPCP